MKVLILSSSDPYKIAGIVAKDLLESLNADKSIKATLLVRVWGKYTSDDIISLDSIITYYVDWFRRKIKGVLRLAGIYGRESKQIKNSDPQYTVRDYDQTKAIYSTQRILDKYGSTPDVIIVLFMSKFLTYKNLYELNQRTKAPILLYMMDMAPFTGICHYAWNCEGYINECGQCPALYSNNPLDQSYLNLAFKKQFVEQTNLFPIAASEKQFFQLSNSHLFRNKRKLKVLLSVDEKQFHPFDKLIARKKLALPENGQILFLGAGSFTEKRKGLDELISALNLLAELLGSNEDIHLAIAGNNHEISKKSLPFPYTLLGNLNHTDLAYGYSSADVFISPSIEDSGPMMINQSLMCGTPVVSFEMGVALDLVITGKTGYRAKLKDSVDLAKGIYEIFNLDKSDYETLSFNCRQIALEKCSKNAQLKSFKDIFEETVFKN